jgi:hypothetical protein
MPACTKQQVSNRQYWLGTRVSEAELAPQFNKVREEGISNDFAEELQTITMKHATLSPTITLTADTTSP